MENLSNFVNEQEIEEDELEEREEEGVRKITEGIDSLNQQEEETASLEQNPEGFSNTGPKGVIADYKIAKKKLEKKIILDNQEKWRQIYNNNPQLLDKPQNYNQEDQEESEENDVIGASLSSILFITNFNKKSDDDEFLRKYREQRMQQIKQEEFQKMQHSNK